MKSLQEHLQEQLIESKSIIKPEEMEKICTNKSNFKKIAKAINVPEEFVEDVLQYIIGAFHAEQKAWGPYGAVFLSKDEWIDYLTGDDFPEYCSNKREITDKWSNKLEGDIEDKLYELGEYFVKEFLK